MPTCDTSFAGPCSTRILFSSRSMPAFTEEFERNFRDARQRVSPHANGKRSNGKEAKTAGVSLNDFQAYMPMHAYIFEPTGELWPASSVNSRFPHRKGSKKASHWLDRNRPVEQMTWAPGEPKIIGGRLIAEGGWIDRAGSRCFNLYRPPMLVRGNADKAGPWTDHVRRVYGEEASHIIRFLAHRVQKPEEKINHALVLGGSQVLARTRSLNP
jgi:hypothetical protein